MTHTTRPQAEAQYRRPRWPRQLVADRAGPPRIRIERRPGWGRALPPELWCGMHRGGLLGPLHQTCPLRSTARRTSRERGLPLTGERTYQHWALSTWGCNGPPPSFSRGSLMLAPGSLANNDFPGFCFLPCPTFSLIGRGLGGRFPPAPTCCMRCPRTVQRSAHSAGRERHQRARAVCGTVHKRKPPVSSSVCPLFMIVIIITRAATRCSCSAPSSFDAVVLLRHEDVLPLHPVPVARDHRRIEPRYGSTSTPSPW